MGYAGICWDQRRVWGLQSLHLKAKVFHGTSFLSQALKLTRNAQQCPANRTAVQTQQVSIGFLAHELGHILVDAGLLAWRFVQLSHPHPMKGKKGFQWFQFGLQVSKV